MPCDSKCVFVPLHLCVISCISSSDTCDGSKYIQVGMPKEMFNTKLTKIYHVRISISCTKIPLFYSLLSIATPVLAIEKDNKKLAIVKLTKKLPECKCILFSSLLARPFFSRKNKF